MLPALTLGGGSHATDARVLAAGPVQARRPRAPPRRLPLDCTTRVAGHDIPRSRRAGWVRLPRAAAAGYLALGRSDAQQHGRGDRRQPSSLAGGARGGARRRPPALVLLLAVPSVPAPALAPVAGPGRVRVPRRKRALRRAAGGG